MTIAEEYLRAYDDQLRTEAETLSAHSVTVQGPLLLATFAGGLGFITYRDLAGATAADMPGLVAGAKEHFRTDPGISRIEWKTRRHDAAPGLAEALLAAGFVPEDAESIMVGPVAGLCTPVPLPDGVTVRQVHAEEDVRAMSAMVDTAFGEETSLRIADSLLARLARQDGLELWVAEADGVMVSGGRLEPVPHSDFAGVWGGATLPAYRGRGLYRALLAARAASARELGKTLIHSDSTEDSRPILERSGLVKVSTTVPYYWTR